MTAAKCWWWVEIAVPNPANCRPSACPIKSRRRRRPWCRRDNIRKSILQAIVVGAESFQLMADHGGAGQGAVFGFAEVRLHSYPHGSNVITVAVLQRQG